MERNIEKLLPHRHPFLFVDKILSCTEKEIIGTMTFDVERNSMLTGSFPESGVVPGVIMIESMAQCGGAGVKMLDLADGFFGLAAMKNVQFFKGVRYGEELVYKIKNLKISNRIIKQSGTAHCHGELICEAEWFCARID